MVDLKTGAALVITLVIVIFFMGGFSELIGIDLKNPLQGREVLPEKRDLPLSGQINSPLESLAFSQSNMKATNIAFRTEGDIVVGSTRVKSNDIANISFKNFTGVMQVSNGTFDIKGIAHTLSLGGYSFVGANTISASGNLIEFNSNIDADINLPQASGSINILVSNATQNITIRNNQLEIKSFKGAVRASYANNMLYIDGIAARVTAAGITISK